MCHRPDISTIYRRYIANIEYIADIMSNITDIGYIGDISTNISDIFIPSCGLVATFLTFILLSLCHDKCRKCRDKVGLIPVHNYRDIYFFVMTNIDDLHFYLQKVCRDQAVGYCYKVGHLTLLISGSVVATFITS